MSFRTSQAAQAERAGGGAGREINWPLPLAGLYSNAVRGEVRGVLASALRNLRPDGPSLKLRDGFRTVGGVRQDTYQRITFMDGLLEVNETNLYYNGVDLYEIEDPTYDVTFVSTATISSNMIIAGVGPLLKLDGATIEDAGFVTSDGRETDTLDGVLAHHDRIYAWSSEDLGFYYSDQVGAVTGDLIRFQLDRLGNLDGVVVALATMTMANAARGMSDVLVVMTSTGWILLYEGLDPGDATSWSLIGRIKTSPVLGKFAIHNIGSDLWFMTAQGVASLRECLANGATALVSSLAKDVADLMARDLNLSYHEERMRTQISTFPNKSRVVVNIHTGGWQSKQYMLELESGAWWTADYPAVWWTPEYNQMRFSMWSEPGDKWGGLYAYITSDEHTDVTPNGAAFKGISFSWASGWIRSGYGSINYVIPTLYAGSDLSLEMGIFADHNWSSEDEARIMFPVSPTPELNTASALGLPSSQVVPASATGHVFSIRVYGETGMGFSIENLTAGVS